jgi:hypothetical protein
MLEVVSQELRKMPIAYFWVGLWLLRVIPRAL